MTPRFDLPPSTEQAAEALAAIARSSPDAIFTLGIDGTILTWNRGAERLYEVPTSDAIGRTFRDIFPHEDVDSTAWTVDVIRSGRAVENLYLRWTWPDGSQRDLVVTMSPIIGADGEVHAIASIVADITRLKNVERDLAASLAELKEVSRRDRLTGIGSRDLLLERLSTLPADATDICVLLVDVDEFQYFNQTFGQGTGDAVLKAFVAVVTGVLDGDDLLARTGGDEFAIVSHSKGPHRGVDLAGAVHQALSEPLVIGTELHSVSVGVGIATASRVLPGLADFLLRRADMALDEAKQVGHGLSRTYDAEMEAAFAARAQMEERLRAAVGSANQLWLAYQPICDTDTEEITEVEALLRWEDPIHGSIPPDRFIPVAESCGLIVAMGEWVLRDACMTIAALNGTGARLRLNVNVSPRQLVDPGFAASVSTALQVSGLAPDRLVLEITESAIAGSGETLVAELVQLRELGVGLAVDDFGTGHSSLGRLHSLPFTTLKIDKSLIDGIGEGTGGDIIIDAVVGMAHGLALTVVAEGVERASQMNRLRELGCDLVQGYMLHRPMLLADLKQLLGRQVRV